MMTDINALTIRNETEKDYRIVESLTRKAFWNVYKPGCDEHFYVHNMRSHKDFVKELAFVIEKNHTIIGNIMFTKSRLISDDGEEKSIVSFGPISILPEFQRQGCSRLLIEHSFDTAAKLGYEAIVNFGNPSNYVSRGFVSCRKKNISLSDGSFPTNLLVKEFVPGTLDGKSWTFLPSTAKECCLDTEAVEEFDKTFPKMEKAWRPSQEEYYIYSHSCVVK